MPSSVISSVQANSVNMAILRVFAQMRQLMNDCAEPQRKN